MNRESFANLRDWVEPAHPGIIDQFDELIHIYEVVRIVSDRDGDRGVRPTVRSLRLACGDGSVQVVKR